MEGDDFVVDGSGKAPVPAGGGRGSALAALVLAGSVLALATVDAARAAEAAGPTEAVASADPAAEPIIDSESPEPAARWSTASEFAAGNYKWSLSRGSLDLGLRFDTPARNRSLAMSPLDASGPFVQTLPTVSLDLRRIEMAPGGSWLRQLAGGDLGMSVTHRMEAGGVGADVRARRPGHASGRRRQADHAPAKRDVEPLHETPVLKAVDRVACGFPFSTTT